MRAKQLLRPSVMLLLAVAATAALAQPRPCSTLPLDEREFARALGACRDIAPIVDVVPAVVPAAVPREAEAAPAVVMPVPNVVGLSFDDARDRLPGLTLRRSYRASAEPGGTVLEQQPAPPARVASGATITVVLSDASLRPAPRVTGARDETFKPRPANPDLQPQPAVVAGDTRTGSVIEQIPAARATQPTTAVQPRAPADAAKVGARVEQVRVPSVVGMTIKNAQARLGRFKVERSDRPGTAPIGRVIEQTPKASARTPAGSAIVLVVSSGPAPVTETFELPNVVDHSYADASNALAEFKVDRIEIVASAAPSGQVLAQDPAPGTSVVAGSVIRLQVSDGSLASVATAPPEVTPPAPVAAPAPAAVPAPIEVDRSPDNTTPALIAAALLVLGLVALLMRGWLPTRRRPTIDIEPAPQLGFSPAEIDIGNVPVAEIRFSARVDEGETTIEFAALSDADETTLEHSRELHE